MTDRSEWSDERLRSAFKTLAGAVDHVGIPELQAGVFIPDRQSRRRRVAAFAAATLVVTAGVVAFAVARHTPTRFGTPATESFETVETTAVEPSGLPVVVRGVVHADSICPAREPRCENGVKVSDTTGQAFPDGTPVELKGTFDGTSLHESMPAVTWADYVPLTPLPPSPCPSLANHDAPQSVDRTALLVAEESFRDRIAATWVDNSTNVEVVWLVGEDIEVPRSAIEKASGDRAICVIGGAQYSFVELQAISDGLTALEKDDLLVSDGSRVDPAGNFALLSLALLSPEGRKKLTNDFGDRVRLQPLVELTSDSLEALRNYAASHRGGVDILTQVSSGSYGLDAIREFELDFDPELNCLYATEMNSVARVAPVWPAGFAVNDDRTIVDSDLSPVARGGDTITLRGGYEKLTKPYLIGDNLCNASEMWIVASVEG